MNLASLLHPELVVLKKSWSSLDDVVNHLVKEIYRVRPLERPQEQVLEAIRERQSLGGTVFATGIAVPHARLEQFNDLVIAVAVPHKPLLLEYPVRMVVLMLTNRGASNVYLNTLSAFMQLSKDEKQLSSLAASANPAEFVERLRAFQYRVTREVHARDLMSRELVYISPQDTVKSAIDLMFANNIGYLPVLGDDGTLLGEISVLDLFTLRESEASDVLPSIRSIKSFEPFENLLRNERHIPISDIMRPVEFALAEDSLLVEVVMEFTKRNRRYFPVVRADKLVGVLSYMDILNKVIRA